MSTKEGEEGWRYWLMALRQRSPALTSVLVLLLLAIPVSEPLLHAEEESVRPIDDLNTILMENTFRLEGKGKGGIVTGTVFLIGNQRGDKPDLRIVLVTAAHVLADIVEDFATLHLRQKAEGNEWTRVPFALPIKNKGEPLWTKHPKADIAVMYVRLPSAAVSAISRHLDTSLLADDDMLRRYEIHPGDTLYSLGYPLGFESNGEGFPILRSGKIASYPLIPTNKTKTFMMDFEVFGGNSGGPVYFVDHNRTYNQATHLGQTNRFIVGVLIQQVQTSQIVRELFPERTQQYPVKLAVVVHASLLKETISLLP